MKQCEKFGNKKNSTLDIHFSLNKSLIHINNIIIIYTIKVTPIILLIFCFFFLYAFLLIKQFIYKIISIVFN